MIETIFALGRGEVGNGFWTELFSLQGTGELHIAKIVLPIGISFFTFQAMSYVIDVYQESTPPQRNILDFALYVSLFPQLIAGPIVQYSDIARQLEDRRELNGDFLYGIKRFCLGLGKKVLIANTLEMWQTRCGLWRQEALVLGVLGSGFIGRYQKKFPQIYDWYPTQIGILILSILSIISGTYNPFIYFQF